MENKKTVFVVPEETSLIDIISEILKNNNLEESAKEFNDKDDQDIEPRAFIILDAAFTIAEKKIPDGKLAEFLANHLGISVEIAIKIVQEIHRKIIPFAKIDNTEEEANIEREQSLPTQEETSQNMTEEERKQSFRIAKEELLKKIGANNMVRESKNRERALKEVPTPYKKIPDIVDVEDNAKSIDKFKKPIIPVDQKLIINPIPKQIPDKYKESIE